VLKDLPMRTALTNAGRALSRVVLVLGVFFVLCLGYGVGLKISGNFHVLVAGEAYRSAQPTPAQLARWHEEVGFASIVNLRGENTGSDWYDAEIATARRLGIAHYDVRLSSRRAVGQPEAEALIALLRDVPKPVLIHCNGGADRSGLASALYMGAIAHRGHWAAESQLSPLYGHLPLSWLRAFPMTESFENLEGWMGLSGD
jgi:protein tyrosine phosphatase (PTP) superfamily phosphohydrolase (DUF442 family)